MKTKLTLVGLAILFTLTGCGKNSASTSEKQSTSVSETNTTTQIQTKSRSEKLQDAASNVLPIFDASTSSFLKEDTTFTYTLTNLSINKEGVFSIKDLNGYFSISSFNVEDDQEIKIAISCIFTSGSVSIDGVGELPSIAGLGFKIYLIDNSLKLDLSNVLFTTILAKIVSLADETISPEYAPFLIDEIIGKSHKTSISGLDLPLKKDVATSIKESRSEIEKWYSEYNFDELNKDEYKFFDSGFSLTERKSGAIESTLSIGKSGFYALAIAEADSDEKLIETTNEFETIQTANMSLGIKTDAELRLTYASLYLDLDVLGEDQISFEGTITLNITYDYVGVTMPTSFSEYTQFNLEKLVGNI